MEKFFVCLQKKYLGRLTSCLKKKTIFNIMFPSAKINDSAYGQLIYTILFAHLLPKRLAKVL